MRVGKLSATALSTNAAFVLTATALAATALAATALAATTATAQAATAGAGLPSRAHLTAAHAVKKSALAGFVEFDPNGPTHIPYYNSAGGPAGVVPGGTVGQYQVIFPKLGFTGGDAQLTAQSGACTIQSWAKTAAGDLAVNVDCFDSFGPAAQAFDLTVTKPTRAPAGVLDYALVPASGAGLVSAYQYNSSHKANKVKHLGTGRYLVTMPGPGTAGARAGTVKISAYGNVSGSCQLARWRGTSSGQQIYVDCFALTGARQDTAFTMAYARGTNVMGQDGMTDANALANSGAELYQPRVQYDSRHGARVTVARLEPGLYLFVPAGSDLTGHHNGGLGDLQITAVGSSFADCGFGIRRTHLPLIEVVCIDKNGSQVKSAFTAQWTVN